MEAPRAPSIENRLVTVFSTVTPGAPHPNDFVEQSSDSLAKNHRLVVFEDLHLPAMTRSAKGTVASPGKRVRQKSGLNRVVLDKSLGAILSRTEDKAPSHGHRVLCVPVLRIT